jgi:hypothetical protein
MTELCIHELSKATCDICTPRKDAPRQKVVQRSAPLVETDTVVVAANVAYPEYLKHHAYVCQPDRSFRPSTQRMAFYANEAIQREVPEILEVRDRVPFNRVEVDRLRAAGGETNNRLADLIAELVRTTPRSEGADFKVMLLSPMRDARTVQIPHKVVNSTVDYKGTNMAFTQGQRYTSLELLEKGPRTTDELISTGTDDDEEQSP